MAKIWTIYNYIVCLLVCIRSLATDNLSDIWKLTYSGTEKSQRSVTYDFLRYINTLTYLVIYTVVVWGTMAHTSKYGDLSFKWLWACLWWLFICLRDWKLQTNVYEVAVSALHQLQLTTLLIILATEVALHIRQNNAVIAMNTAEQKRAITASKTKKTWNQHLWKMNCCWLNLAKMLLT